VETRINLQAQARREAEGRGAAPGPPRRAELSGAGHLFRSPLGQLAVAKVILNRVKDPEYPKSICGVVYQGATRSNSCQFSFACDGLPDEPRSREAWQRASRVAQKALEGDQTVKVMGAATHYHADYVRPRWSRHMKRLIKIGRHIFYQDS
jgi:spore germination cell wall hydrolase CwlJ-like protein